MPRIARCARDDQDRTFFIDWLPYITQLCMGAQSHGVPFGKVRYDFQHPQKKLSVMKSCKAHLDWELYRLPAPHMSDLASAKTCLIVLSLFAAFPVLTSIPAFNHGGKGWTGTNHAMGQIGVGNCHDGKGSIYCLSVDGQISLRELLLQHTQHVFTTDVNSCVTFSMHKAAREAAVAGDA
jgi:hypothetical protein